MRMPTGRVSLCEALGQGFGTRANFWRYSWRCCGHNFAHEGTKHWTSFSQLSWTISFNQFKREKPTKWPHEDGTRGRLGQYESLPTKSTLISHRKDNGLHVHMVKLTSARKVSRCASPREVDPLPVSKDPSRGNRAPEWSIQQPLLHHGPLSIVFPGRGTIHDVACCGDGISQPSSARMGDSSPEYCSIQCTYCGSAREAGYEWRHLTTRH